MRSCTHVGDEHHPATGDGIEPLLHLTVLLELLTEVVRVGFILTVSTEIEYVMLRALNLPESNSLRRFG